MGKVKRNYSHADVVDLVRAAMEFGNIRSECSGEGDFKYALKAANHPYKWQEDAARLIAEYDGDEDA